MPQGEWALAMETAGVGAARSQVLSDAFNRSQIGRAVIEAKFSSYATHKILTGYAVGECDWPVTREVQLFGQAKRWVAGQPAFYTKEKKCFDVKALGGKK